MSKKWFFLGILIVFNLLTWKSSIKFVCESKLSFELFRLLFVIIYLRILVSLRFFIVQRLRLTLQRSYIIWSVRIRKGRQLSVRWRLRCFSSFEFVILLLDVLLANLWYVFIENRFSLLGVLFVTDFIIVDFEITVPFFFNHA